MKNNNDEDDIIQIEFNGPTREAERRTDTAVRGPNPQIIELQAVAKPTRKRRGEAAEAAFLARATHLGFSVCLPWGDSERCCHSYTAAEIDFFVAFIVPEDIWYIIPIAAIGHRKGTRFYPHTCNSQGHFEKYREA